jgi:short-subunit dehydrogenase
VSKHGVVALSEVLHHELAEIGAKLKVSVLFPGYVSTRIMDSDRSRPPNLLDDPAEVNISPLHQARWNTTGDRVQAGRTPYQVADSVFRAIREERFYILTHPEYKNSIRARMEDIIEERNPTLG